MLVHWIWLSTRPGLNDRDRLALLERFHDPEELYYQGAAACDSLGGTEKLRAALSDRDLTEAEKLLEQCRRKEIRVLTYAQAEYPARLRTIPDPPLVLYAKGELPDFEAELFIAVVGTRKASLYGLSAARQMGYQIGNCGGIVVSGLAAGADAAAAKGALLAGKQVVGVLGCGVDVVFPASNRALFAQVERQGCLLSEFPPGTPGYPWNFPKRNRILSGMCSGVVVVEAPEKSGALITARLAAEQGRDVFVVPGNINVSTGAGSNALLREGAGAVSSGWDVVSEYASFYPGRLHKDLTAPPMPGEVLSGAARDRADAKVAQTPEPVKKKAPGAAFDKRTVDKAPPQPYSDGKERNEPLPPAEQAVMEQLREGPKTMDALTIGADLPPEELMTALTMLQMKGRIAALPGGYFSGR